MRFHARAEGDTEKKYHRRFQPTTVSGGPKTRTVAVRQERCTARFFLQKVKDTKSKGECCLDESLLSRPWRSFRVLRIPKGATQSQEARDMANDYINVITGRFYRPYQNFEDN